MIKILLILITTLTINLPARINYTQTECNTKYGSGKIITNNKNVVVTKYYIEGMEVRTVTINNGKVIMMQYFITKTEATLKVIKHVIMTNTGCKASSCMLLPSKQGYSCTINNKTYVCSYNSGRITIISKEDVKLLALAVNVTKGI